MAKKSLETIEENIKETQEEKKTETKTNFILPAKIFFIKSPTRLPRLNSKTVQATLEHSENA